MLFPYDIFISIFCCILTDPCVQELDAHVVDVIYTLLDEDGDENLSTREFNPILFQWRHSRGFQKGSLAMSVGSLRF